MSFQSTILLIATVILCLMLLFIAYLLYKAKYTSKWPPEISQCPDYWEVVGPNKCKVSTKNLNGGNGNCETEKDFSSSEWAGKAGFDQKRSWSEQCGVFWEGISDKSYMSYGETEDIQTGSATTGISMFDNLFEKYGSEAEKRLTGAYDALKGEN